MSETRLWLIEVSSDDDRFSEAHLGNITDEQATEIHEHYADTPGMDAIVNPIAPLNYEDLCKELGI